MKKKFDQNRLINKLNERIEELTFKEQDINGAIKILSEKIDNLTYKEQDINGAIKILSEKIDNLTYKDQDINGAIKILSEKIDNLTYKDQDIENVIKNLSRITNKLEKYKKQQKIDQSKLINKLNKQIEELTFKEHDIDGALKMLFEKTGKLEDGEIKSLFERIGKLEDGAIKSLFERIGKLENGTIKMLSERISKLEDGAIKTLFERIGKLENGTIKMLSERISKLEKECKRQQKIKILQIYPKVEAANQLRQWMEIEGYGKGIIDVNSVCLTNFNKEPYEWLKLGDKWNYDIILFGIWDANCGIPLEDKAVNAITAFINDGGGCILTHDTTGFTYGKSGFNKLREMFGIKVGKWGKNPFGDYDNQWGYFSTKIKITKTGSLTTYPWKIGEINKVFPVLSTHTTSTAAYKDNVWIELCEGDYKCGKEPNAL
ncbi:hypothetical protein BCR32DRAFT_328223 [Anaeromyces robustus]|uniref:Uncharacterized protein n=1 Tax=Anaeromyces robustus TaxID=1754192 RepID=A0A1Y1X0F7_9FUNG|nr:hypothetical protein BCR32DRAFT_328223 [Anaeromyces robustus]|eukprot:ORX79223.1 hypothetical protein BCR32DRAFT_328223 [Anaeromyces robustus]